MDVSAAQCEVQFMSWVLLVPPADARAGTPQRGFPTIVCQRRNPTNEIDSLDSYEGLSLVSRGKDRALCPE